MNKLNKNEMSALRYGFTAFSQKQNMWIMPSWPMRLHGFSLVQCRKLVSLGLLNQECQGPANQSWRFSISEAGKAFLLEDLLQSGLKAKVVF